VPRYKARGKRKAAVHWAAFALQGCGKRLVGEGAEEREEKAGEQRRGGQGEYPGGGDVADGGQLQPALVGSHGAGDAGTEDVGGADGQSEIVCGEDGGHGDEFGSGALGVGEVFLADFFANGDDDALPSHHGAEAEGESHSDLHPRGDELGSFVDLGFVVVEGGSLIFREESGPVLIGGLGVGLGHNAERLAGDIHVIANVGLLVGGNALITAVGADVAFEVADELAQGGHGGGLNFLGAEIVGEFGARVGTEDGLAVDVSIDDRYGALRGGDEVLDVVRGHGVIEGVGGGHGADEDEHDEAHTLLAVVRSVEEADASAGEHQENADGEGGRGVVLGRGVELGIFDQGLGDKEEKGCASEPDDGGDEEHLEDLDGLLPVDARGAAAAWFSNWLATPTPMMEPVMV
jgi:hypothetical protein